MGSSLLGERKIFFRDSLHCSVIITNFPDGIFFYQQFLADPEIIIPNMVSQTQSVKLGKSWNITCQARGNPAPTVEWIRKNGNKSVTSREYGSSGVVLSIDSVVEDDLGIYFCVALNSKNVAYAYVTLGKIIGHYTPHLGRRVKVTLKVVFFQV